MKRFLVFILVIALVFSLTACGSKDGTEAVKETESLESLEEFFATQVNQPETTAPESVTGQEVSGDAEETTSAEEVTTAEVVDMTKEEFAAFLNAETAKIVKNGTYNLVRKCVYTRAVDIGGATDAINTLIKAIDEDLSLDTVIGMFLGMGTIEGKIPGDDVKDDYKIKGTSLKPDDLGSFNASNGVYTFTLTNATDPKKTGATAFSRFTNDFVTHEEVVASIAEFISVIKVKETKADYTNIMVMVTVKDRKITEIKYSYDFYAMLAVSLGATIPGDGKANNRMTYSDIKY